MVTGRTKGLTLRGKGNVVLVAAQLDDPDGNPTEQYVLLRSDEFGRLRTIDAGAVATFLGLTDTPATYTGSELLNVRVNTAGDALEFAAFPGGNDPPVVTGAPGDDRWSIPGWYGDDQGSVGITANEMIFIPILVAETRTYIRIGVQVSGAGGGGTVARMGIYNATLGATGLVADGLVLDAGTVSVATTGSKEIVISQELTGNTWYYLVFVSDGTPTCNHFEAADAITSPVTGHSAGLSSDLDRATQSRAGQGIGALPDPAPAITGVENATFAGLVRLRDI